MNFTFVLLNCLYTIDSLRTHQEISSHSNAFCLKVLSSFGPVEKYVCTNFAFSEVKAGLKGERNSISLIIFAMGAFPPTMVLQPNRAQFWKAGI